MPQFDVFSNFYIIQIFFVFFLIFYVFCCLIWSSFYKYTIILKINKEQYAMCQSNKKLLQLMLKIKKFWYLKNFKK